MFFLLIKDKRLVNPDISQSFYCGDAIRHVCLSNKGAINRAPTSFVTHRIRRTDERIGAAIYRACFPPVIHITLQRCFFGMMS